MGSGLADYGFGRCDGHHEMIDLQLRKKTTLQSVSAED
jgi:hypothetical protein